MSEFDDFERDKLEVSKYNKKGFDLGLSKDEWWWCVTNINEQMGVLMEDMRVLPLLPAVVVVSRPQLASKSKGARE